MSSENISSGPLDHASERSNGDRRPPSPAPVKSSRRSGSRSSSPPRRRPRTPPSRDYSRGGGGGSYDRDRRRNFSPRRRNRSRSPEHRGGRDRDRRSRSTSPRGRRAWSPRGRRRPRTPPVPPPQGMNHGPNVPAYVPQPIYGDQYQQPYGQYGMPQYNAAGFAPNYGTAPGMNPYIGPSGYGQPGMVPGMNPEYMAQPPGWGGPQPVVAQPPVNVQDDAVALEMEQQKATLRKQREDYEKRRVVLRRELKILKEQRQKLTSGSDEPPSPTTKNFIKENDRLQAQIENKMSTIDNVIEMLTNIIGKEVPEQEPPPPGQEPPVLQPSDPRMRKREESQRSAKESSNDEDSESEKLKTKVLESMKQRSKAKEGTTAVNPEQQVNYAFYDPELHWCKSCNVFPKTAKDYLQHLHSKEHMDATKKANDSPWHENNPNVGMPSYNGAPTRRTPIRGLQFFVPATAWYCKLCSTWMGDLHCASLHLKSQCHSDSIAKFVEHNPDFEVDWIAERQKSLDMQQGVISRGIVDPEMNGQGDEEGGHKTLFEGIPLQLNLLGKARTTSESTAKEPKKSSSGRDKKKKSSSKKEKKEAKKKKTKSSKKRSSSTSSSSSSSDSDDDSSSSSSSANAEAERVKALLSLTKRQQQEQQEKQNQQQQQTSIRNQMRKMETEHTEDRRREEVTRRRGDSPIDQDARKRRRRSPEEERGRSRSPGGFDNNRYRQADRRRDRSRERQYRGRRDSRSRSPAYRRRRSRSRSRSRSPRRIEKPVVNYPPPFKPRVAEKKPVTMEKRKSPPPKKPTVPLPAGKKLPFIGRMPVFKKQGLEEANKAKEGDDGVVNYNPKVEKGEEEKKVKEEEEKRKEEEHLEQENHQQNDDDDELMPDPEQLQRLMESERRQEQEQQQQQQEEILPPGIDESESDLIPKPINDAPVPRRGPLPKDLEDALNIIFPGEKPEGSGQPERKPFVVTGHIKDNGTEIIMGPEPEDEVAQNTAAMYQAFSAYHQQEEGVVPSEDNSVSVEGPGEGMEGKLVAPGIESGEATGESEAVDMDELAMLGIDATDLAAQCV